MTTCNPGDIVLLQFQIPGRKKPVRRPAIVVNPPEYAATHHGLLVLPLTTIAQNDPALAVKLWESYGLPKASWVKPQLVTVGPEACQRVLSSLAATDHDCVRQALRLLIDEKW